MFNKILGFFAFVAMATIAGATMLGASNEVSANEVGVMGENIQEITIHTIEVDYDDFGGTLTVKLAVKKTFTQTGKVITEYGKTDFNGIVGQMILDYSQLRDMTDTEVAAAFDSKPIQDIRFIEQIW